MLPNGGTVAVGCNYRLTKEKDLVTGNLEYAPLRYLFVAFVNKYQRSYYVIRAGNLTKVGGLEHLGTIGFSPRCSTDEHIADNAAAMSQTSTSQSHSVHFTPSSTPQQYHSFPHGPSTSLRGWIPAIYPPFLTYPTTGCVDTPRAALADLARPVHAT